MGNVPEQAQALANNVAGSVYSSWDTVPRGFAVKNISERAAEAIEKNPNVRRVTPDIKGTYGVRESVGSDPGDAWGLDRVDQRSGFDGVYTAGATGSGVTAYVLDSGVRISHYTFDSRASHGYDFIDNDGTANDCNGHGTHVAGTLGGAWHGVAQEVGIVALRVGDCSAPTVSATVDALEWVVNNHSGGPAVINMSLGFPPNSALDNATQNAIDAGFTVVVSAGNDNWSACNPTPARVADAITIAASDVNDNRAGFSNFGSCVDLFAPGEQILSAGIGSDSDTEAISGTSMAAPHVAGTAAIYLENNPSASPQQVRDAIVQHSTKNVVSDAQSANDHMLYSLLNHPKAPKNLTSSCVPDDTPRLDWYASPSSDVDYYVVERSTNSSQGYSSIGTSQTTDYNDTSLWCADGGNADDAYYYRVHAVDTENLPSGESNWDGVLTTNDPPYFDPYSAPRTDSLQTVR